MSKIKHIALLALLLCISLVFFRNSLVYQPILNHLEKRFTKKWNCEIDKKSRELNLLKGSLRFKDIHLTTPTKTGSNWTLDADEIFIRINYFSLFSSNLIVNELILDGLIFSHEQCDTYGPKKSHMSPAMITTQTEKGIRKEKAKRKGALVRDLVIRDGYFKFGYLTASGKARVITVEHVTLNRRDIFLGRDPHVFFRPLLKPLGYPTHIRP